MMTSDKYISSMIDLGLKPQEAKVYLACLKLGQETVGKIASEAGVQRTFVYDIIDDLHGQGFVSSVVQRGKKYYSPISIEQFKKRQEAKLLKFANIIPELKAIEKSVGDQPKVRFYEGGEGIKTALEDTLAQPAGSEILGFATAEGFYASEPDFMNDYLRRRAKQKIFYKAIGPDTEINRGFAQKDREQMRETRLISAEKYPFTNEIDIYGNKVLILSLQGELLAVMIESESVAKTQRMIFELAWLGAQSTGSASEKLKGESSKGEGGKDEHLLAKIGQYALIENKNGEILALQRARSKEWSLPGGRLDVGESPKEALNREIEEETGLFCRIGDIIDTALITDEYQTKYCTYYLAESRANTEIKLGPEHISYKWIGKDNIHEYQFEYPEVQEIVEKKIAGSAWPN